MFSFCCAATADESPLMELTTKEDSPRKSALNQTGKATVTEASPTREVRLEIPTPLGGSTLLGHPMNQATAPRTQQVRLQLEACTTAKPSDTPKSSCKGAESCTPKSFGLPACTPKSLAKALETPRSCKSWKPYRSQPGTPTTGGERSPFCGAQEHKERLQEMVTEFIPKALQGVPCAFIMPRKAGAVDRVPAKYLMDEALTSLIVEPIHGGHELARCELAEIRDVVHVEKDGNNCFSPLLKSALPADQAALLLRIEHSISASFNGSHFYLLMESEDERDVFLECVQVLSICANYDQEDTAA